MKLNAYVQSAVTEKAHSLKTLKIIVMALALPKLPAQGATARRFEDILHWGKTVPIQRS